MKNALLYFSILCLLLFALSCQKEPISEITTPNSNNDTEQIAKNNFFDLHYQASHHQYIKKTSANKTENLADTVFLQAIVDDLQAKEAEKTFVGKLANLAGYPIWEYAITHYDSIQERQIAYIPLAKLSDNYTNVILFCIKENDKFYYSFAHSRYNKTLLSAADSLNLPTEELTYRQQMDQTKTYFDINLFDHLINGSSPSSPLFDMVVICTDYICNDINCCDMFAPGHTHTSCVGVGYTTFGGPAGGGNSDSGENVSGDNTSGGSTGNIGSTNDAYSDFWEQMQGLEYHIFLQNLNDFIANNDIELISPAEAAQGVLGYTFQDVYNIAILHDCINAQSNDYIAGSAFDNCLWEAMYVDNPTVYTPSLSLDSFNTIMGLDLSQAEFNVLIQNCSGGTSSTAIFECVKIAYAKQKHAELTIQYSNYSDEFFSQANISSIDDFIAQYGVNQYLATVALYEAMNAPNNELSVPNLEAFEFALEIFSKELLPLGITFIPYGIGDVADIYLSCLGAGGNIKSWGCALAIIGALVPFDELADMWRKSDQVVLAWKAVKNAMPLKDAWVFIRNCPFSIRTDSFILQGVKVALQRTLKTVDQLVTHANVSYIDQATITHIFRGSNNGGVHHISALMANPDTYKIHNRVPTTNGCYKATVYKNGVVMQTPGGAGKSFFPDEWSEEQVVNAIKEAYANAPSTPVSGTTNNFIGTSNGIQIRFYKDTNGKIISAFPNY